MNVDELCDVEAQTQMHPAIDVVDGVLYVTVRVGIRGKGGQDIILSSNGEAFNQEEWRLESEKRGLIPLASASLRDGKPRWNVKGIKGLEDKSLTAPDWKDVYDAIYHELDARLQVRDHRYLVVLTLFAMMTYFHPLFDFLPILHLRGPAESGKSRAGSIVGYVSFNGSIAGRATASSIFRNAHEGRYTQVVTEADHLAMLDSGDSFVQQLQAGCSKSEAWVEVTEGGKGQPFQTARYFIFNPRVLLSTKHFKSHPLRSRCIELDLVKTANTDETKLRRSKDDDKIWAPLRDMMYRLMLLSWQDVVEAQEHLKTTWRGKGTPKGRTFEKWLPLATVASLVSEDVLIVVKELASEDMTAQQEDAEDTFEAVMFKFALWVAGENDVWLKEEEIYDQFTAGLSTSPDNRDMPTWARNTDTPVTYEQLNRWVKTKRHLVKELKRLNLIPKDPKHDRERGHIYLFSKEAISGTVGAYLGSKDDEKEHVA